MRTAALVLICGIAISCSAPSHLQKINNEPMLIGTVSEAELFKSFPVFKSNFDSFKPTPDHLSMMRQIRDPLVIEIFLGTWCGDSKRHVPPFLKLLSESGNPAIAFHIYGLDRTKKDAAGLTERFQVTRVPTMVVLRAGQEIGRITEHPTLTIADDLIAILRK